MIIFNKETNIVRLTDILKLPIKSSSSPEYILSSDVMQLSAGLGGAGVGSVL